MGQRGAEGTSLVDTTGCPRLDTTCYMIAAGECGNKNIGQSRIIDPLGVTISAAADVPTLIMAEITAERIRQVRAQLPVLCNRRFVPPQLL